jgi:hypothetical protein
MGKICYTAVLQFIGNITKTEFAVNEQIFNMFNFLCNNIGYL